MKKLTITTLSIAAVLATTLHSRAQSSEPTTPAPTPWAVGDDESTDYFGEWESATPFRIDNESKDDVCVVLQEPDGYTHVFDLSAESIWSDVLPANWKMRITDKRNGGPAGLLNDRNRSGASGSWRTL
ncbi:MAG: hypothetical protein AAGA20_12875 [Planctomycetota bacterium]